MARNSYNVENGFNIEGINENLLSKGVKGNLPIEEFKQLIAEIKEFSKAADEARASYEKMIAEGLKPTRDQLKEIKKYRGQSDRLAKAQLQADASTKNAGTKGRAAMAQKLSKELGRASDSAHGRASYGNRFALNKEKGYAEKNQEDYLRSQQDSKEMFLKNNPRVARRLNGVTGFKGTKYILNNNKSESPKAQEQQPLTQQADSAEKDAERIVKATEEVKKAEESTVSQKTSTDTPLAQEATVAEKSAEQIVKASEEAKKAEQSVTEAKTQTSTGNQGISNVDFMKNLREMYPGWNKESTGHEVMSSLGWQTKESTGKDVMSALGTMYPGWNKESPNTTKVPINVGNEQPKGELVSADKIKAAIDSFNRQIDDLYAKGVAEKTQAYVTQIQELVQKRNAMEKTYNQMMGQTNLKGNSKENEFKSGMTRAERDARRKELEGQGTYRLKDESYESKTQQTPIDNKKNEEYNSLKERISAKDINGQILRGEGNYPKEMADALYESLAKIYNTTVEDLKERVNSIKKEEADKKANYKMAPLPDDSGKALNGVADSTKNIQGEAGKTTSSLKNLDKELKQKKTDSEGASSGFAQFGEVLKNTISTIGKVAQTIGKIGGTIWHGFTAGINAVISGVKTLASGLHSLVSGGFNLLKSAVSTTLGNMQKLVSGGFNAVKNGISAVKKGFENVKNTMTSLVKKGTPNLMKSFGSLKSMLMRRIKRTFISSIFNQAKEGLQQLAKSSRDFDQSMSNIKNTSKQVAGNLAITLGNLIQTIEPVLTTLLGWLNKVFEAINGLFAMISGKKTMLVAKKNTDQYSKSLKNASGSAKDLNHQLYGFDEITRQEDNSSSGGGGKIGYESAEIGDRLGSISDFFKNILDAFKNGQFEKVGQLIAEQLNNAVTAVDKWIKKISPIAGKWAENIADIFNGLLDEKLFTNMGELIGDGLNLAFGVINKFLKKFDFKKLGTRVGNLIKKAFKTIKWDTVGETIANYFNMLPRFLAGFFEELDWGEMGDKIAEGIRSFFSNIDWQARQDAISKGINGVVTFLTSIVTGVDWADFATQLGTHIKDTVHAIDWESMSTLISTGANKLFDAFGNLVDTHFFSDLFGNIGKMIGDALAGIDWGKLAQDIVLGLAELRNAFWSLINNIDLPNLATRLADAINGLLTDTNVQAAWDTASEKATEGLNKIIEAFGKLVADPPDGIDFEGIGKKIGDNVGKFLSNIHWGELSWNVSQGVKGVAQAFNGLVTRVSNYGIASKLADAVNTFFDPAKGGANLVEAAGAAGSGLGLIVDEFTSFLSKLDLESIAGTIARVVRTFFSNMDFATVTSRISEFVLGVITQFNNLIADLVAVDAEGKNLGDRIADSVNAMFVDPDTGEAKTEIFQSLGTSISDALKGILESGKSLLDGIKWDKIAEDIKAWLKGIDWIGILKDLGEFVISLIDSFFNSMGEISAAIIDWLADINWGEVLLQIVSFLFGAAGSVVGGIVNVIKKTLGGLLGRIFEAVFGSDSREANAFKQWEEDFERDATTAVMHATENASKNFHDGIAGMFDFSYDSQKLAEDADTQAAFIASRWVDSFGMIASEGSDKFKDYMKSYGVDESVIAALEKRYEDLIYAANPQEFTKKLAEYGVNVTDEFGSMLFNATIESEANLAYAVKLMGMGVDENTLQALDLAHLDENLAVYMSKSGKSLSEIAAILMSDNKEELVELAKEMGIEIGDDLGSVTPAALKKALLEGKKSVQEASDELAEIASQTKNTEGMKKKVGEAGNAVADKFAKAQEEGKTKVEDATNANAKAVTEKYEKLPKEVQPYAKQLIEYVCEALADKDGTVHAAIEKVAQDAVDRAKEILNGPAGLEIATTFLNGIRDGIKANNNVVNYVISIANDAVNGASAKMNYANGYRIGQNMITGMYNGFHSYSQKLVDFIAHVCNTCAQTARDILGIHSPSKVFEQIGSYTMEGMQIGLESQGENAIETVSDVANAITEAGENASFENIMGDGFDNVATKLERIVDIFSDMADVIASMGGLEIPTVAAGKTIPYSTQMGGSTFGGANQFAEMDIEDALYNAFTRAMSSSDSEQQVNITLQIDGRKMADIVSKYQRQQSRAWGT